MTRKEITNLIGLATANFPNMQEKDMRPTATLWEKMLADIPYPVAEQALIKLLATNKFFPTVADIREAAENMTGNQLPAADQAWSEVLEQIRRIGSWGIPTFTHPAITEAVKAIGWRNICCSETPGVERAHFMKIYDSVKGRHNDQKINGQVLQLVGGIGLLGS